MQKQTLKVCCNPPHMIFYNKLKKMQVFESNKISQDRNVSQVAFVSLIVNLLHRRYTIEVW